ncbi:MAG: hypothetical protein HYR96_14450, partial [Deltaproteobacteria bacterium]|nr:hypothetical protein [Deltaproteobacteria bacterium]
YLSVTANAYNSSSQVYKNLYAGQDYTYLSSGLVPVLFGFTQTLRKKKFGFAIIVPSSDLIDQNDTVSKKADTTPARSFTRKFFREDITYLIGPAYAFELRNNLAFGISLFTFMHSVKIIDNTLVLYAPDGTGKYFIYQANGTRTSYGLIPKIGLQYMPAPKVSMGLTVSRPFNTGGSGRAQITSTKFGGVEPVELTGIFNNDLSVIEGSTFYEEATPITVSVGSAYFASRRFLLSGQVDYNSAVSYADYPVAQTINWSLGTEFYMSEAWAIRLGAYSNNARTAPIKAGDVNKPPHVDMIGFSLGTGMYRGGTSLTGSISYVIGSGSGQAFSDTDKIHTVNQSSLTLYIGGSYQL